MIYQIFSNFIRYTIAFLLLPIIIMVFLMAGLEEKYEQTTYNNTNY